MNARVLGYVYFQVEMAAMWALACQQNVCAWPQEILWELNESVPKMGSQKWWYVRDDLVSEGTSHCAHKVHLLSLVHITSPLADAIIPEWHSHHVIYFKYSALSKESIFSITEVATCFSHSNPTCMRTTLDSLKKIPLEKTEDKGQIVGVKI